MEADERTRGYNPRQTGSSYMHLLVSHVSRDLYRKLIQHCWWKEKKVEIFAARKQIEVLSCFNLSWRSRASLVSRATIAAILSLSRNPLSQKKTWMWWDFLVQLILLLFLIHLLGRGRYQKPQSQKNSFKRGVHSGFVNFLGNLVCGFKPSFIPLREAPM